MLKILMLHNRYQQKGGEDVSTQNETQLLRDAGHEVDLVEYDNHEIENIGKAKTALRSIWSAPAVRDVQARLKAKNYDIMHVQNYFPLISPAVIWAASKMNVATVQSLRNYRLVCSNGLLFRDGQNCTECVGSFTPLKGIKYKCYRGSMLGSAAIAAMIATHKTLGTWSNHTDAFIAISEYVKDIYARGGFAQDKIYTKPNILAEIPELNEKKLDQLAYIGRLTKEKGVEKLIAAWKMEKRPGTLVIAGDGPYGDVLRGQVSNEDNISFLGSVSGDEVMKIMAKSKAVIAPSIWAEPFGRTVVESFAAGTPVFGAASGGIAELLRGNKGGALYSPGDEKALSELISRAFSDKEWLQKITNDAKSMFAEKYSPNIVLKRTEEIYQHAINRRKNA